MRSPSFANAWLLLALALLSGCDTFRITRPAISGSVVVQHSLTPIAGASVFFEGDKRLFYTDAAGHYSIPEQKKRVGLFYTADRFPRHTLVVAKRGWEPQAVQLTGLLPFENYPAIGLCPVMRSR